MTRLDPARLPLWLRVYEDVGADRYLSHAELPPETGPATRTIWEVYDRLFGRFTGGNGDPLFDRFAHPTERIIASPVLPRGVPIVITGTGPSLDAARDDLRRVRDRILIASSLQGAAALQARGLHADLVLIEHQTIFAAQAAVEDRRHGEPIPLHTATTVLAQPGTPPALLADLGADVCRLTEALPTWGLWPATLVALGLEARAPAIGLVGIDIGPAAGGEDPDPEPWRAADTAGSSVGSHAAPPAVSSAGSPAAAAGGSRAVRPDWAHHPDRPLLALLELLAYASGVCRDCGPGSPPKGGWPATSLRALAEMGSSARQPIAWQHERSTDVFLDEARHDLAAVRPLLPEARDAWAMTLQARAGNTPPYRDLTHAIDLMLAWGTDPPLRRALQHGVGLSFLPRFWRSGIRIGSAAQLWRPLALALHELTTQVDRLEAIVEGPRVGTAGTRDARSRDPHHARAADAIVTGTSVARTPGSQGPSGSPSSLGSHGLQGSQESPALKPPPRPSAPTTAGATRGASAIAGERQGRTARPSPGRVTVLVPLKNGLPHLTDAMASLVAQTHPDVEILVIDDGSDDGGRELVQERAMSHVRVVRSNGQGIAAALNTGLRMATGMYVARQDADDWSHPERLARQCEYLARHPEIDVLATCADFVDAEGRAIETAWAAPESMEALRRQYDALQTPEALARWLPRACCLHHGSIVARRDVLRQAGGYRPALPCAQDYDLSLRLLPRVRFAKLPARLYTSRVHERQTSQQQHDQQRRAIVRAKLEFVLRQAPRLAASARIAVAGDPRLAALFADVWREIASGAGREGREDARVPREQERSSESTRAMSEADAASRAAPEVVPPQPDAPGDDATAWRTTLAQADALLVAEGDRVEAWLGALAGAGEAEWQEVGVCLVRSRLR